MKNFILFSTSYSWFSLYIFNHQNLSLNFIYIEFTNRESSWEILSPLSPFQFPAHYVIQDGAETDRIPSQVVWNIPPLPHHLLPSTVFPSDREFFYPPSLLSLFLHVIFFPLSSLHRVAIQMQERAVRWQQRTVQWRERLFRPFRRVKLPWVSENFIPFHHRFAISYYDHFG